jgi:MoaA/NifB/PqqE/SkfB family radical SAM enzyme
MRPNITGSQNRVLSLENFQKICDSAVSSKMFRYVGLHGWGEPLLNEQLFDMIKYAEAGGLSTNLTTNGRLVGERMEEIFASGLQQIAFGVYDLKLLKKIMPIVMELLKRRDRHGLKIPKIYLDITIYRENLHQIQDFLRIAHELGTDAVILHRLFNVYNINPSIKYITPDEETKLFEEVKRMAQNSAIEIYLPSKHCYPCKVVRCSIFVTVDGEVTPCCFLPEYRLANALEMSLAEVIASASYSNFISKMAKGAICGSCRW